MTTLNPYSGINWGTIQRVVSLSHAHCTAQSDFDLLLQNSGLQHVALSNYYPSTPYYPLTDHFTVPAGVIGSPNAEHHGMTSRKVTHVGRMHLNGLGSTFESGSEYGQEPVGCGGELCETIIARILENLQYSNGGGVTINHPSWSGLTADEVCYLLDVNSKVLGQEIFNQTCLEGDSQGQGADPNDTAANIEIWDKVLHTGRKCWGFAVPDHNGKYSADWKGKNILLVDEMTEEKCLNAYRNGKFYAKIGNSQLAFDSIIHQSGMLIVTATHADTITFVVDGVKSTVSGNTATWIIPPKATYIRAEAEGLNDHIYSNAILLKNKEERAKEIAQEKLIKQAMILL